MKCNVRMTFDNFLRGEGKFNRKTSLIFSGLQELEDPRWRLVYENDAAGKRVSGSKSELVKAALSGASVRIGTGNNYFTAAQNVLVHDDNATVSAELLTHVSKSSWNRMQANTYWWFVILDTNGNFHMTSK